MVVLAALAVAAVEVVAALEALAVLVVVVVGTGVSAEERPSFESLVGCFGGPWEAIAKTALLPLLLLLVSP